MLSQKIYEKACTVIPGGVNSPIRAFKELGLSPLIASSGRGSILTDADGKEYIDCCCSFGSLMHGHAHPQIVAAAQKRIAEGSSFGLTTELESDIAHLVVEHVPSIDKIRFVSSGTESAMSAVRLVRGFTGRKVICKFSGHYHGHGDNLIVEEDVISLPFNNFELCRDIFRKKGEQIAAIVLEPIAANMGVIAPQPGFLEMLREESEKAGALLIFDEVITGFRMGPAGAQGFYNVRPDLSCFGKIIGGGFPAAAFGGRADIMNYLAPLGPVFQAGTLSGNPVAMAAGLESLKLCLEPGFYEKMEERASIITEPVQKLIDEKDLNITLHKAGSMFTLFFGKKGIENLEDVRLCDKAAFKDYFQFLLSRGIYTSPSQCEPSFISSVHTEEQLLHIRDSILKALQ